MQKIAGEYDDRIVYQELNTLDRQIFKNYGISDAIFINNQEIKTIPPLSEDKIRKIINKKLKLIH